MNLETFKFHSSYRLTLQWRSSTIRLGSGCCVGGGDQFLSNILRCCLEVRERFLAVDLSIDGEHHSFATVTRRGVRVPPTIKPDRFRLG
jgi:hypothetical protein